MKKSFIFILLMLAIPAALIACSNGAIDAPSVSLSEPPEAAKAEKPTPAPSAVSYEDNNYIYNRELLEFSAYGHAGYETGTIDLFPVNGQTPNVTHVDDDGNLYTVSISTDESLFCELGMYRMDNKEYIPIITLNNGSTYGFILGVSGDYIVWKEVILSEQKQLSKLHLCNKSGTEDEVFYSDEINPETGSVYVLNDNPVVILGNMIFFDAVSGYSDEGFIEMDVLCYDALAKDITIISKTAKRPSPYLNGIAYLKRNENNGSSLYSYVDGKESFVMAFDEDTADYTIVGETIYKSLFDYEDPTQEKKSIVSTSLYLGAASHPLVQGKQSNYTYHIQANESVMVWEITNPEKPVYYDIANDCFIRLCSEDSGYYASFIGNNFVLFLSLFDASDSESPLYYILIRNEHIS